MPHTGLAPFNNTDYEAKARQFSLQDHNDDPVEIVWVPKEQHAPHKDSFPPFPFQVYLLSTATQLVEDAQFPRKLVAFIERAGGANERCEYHLQVYRRPFPNILACIAHQKREVLFRNRNGISPCLIRTWSQPVGSVLRFHHGIYHGKIMIIDSTDWCNSGITFAHFDTPTYDLGEFWKDAWSGDVDVVRASRCRVPHFISQQLSDDWTGAGAHWTQDDLSRRNAGVASPVLYPAIDPAANFDVDHEEVYELDGTGLPGPAPQGDEDEDQAEGEPKIIDTFDSSWLFKPDDDLGDFSSETYSDTLGLPVASIWNAKIARLKPKFTITLYLAYDFFEKLPIQPKALFGCLNQGLIAQEAWTLDVVQHMPSLDAAFQYHARATAQRTAEVLARRRACTQLVLGKIAGSKLPVEILEYIESLLSPPEIPKYSSRPCRPFKDVFLYLDKTHQYTGPLIVYSNPDDFCTEHHEATLGLQRCPALQYDAVGRPPYRDIADASYYHKLILRVVFQRYWHRVADEIHVLWSLCSSRCIEVDSPIIPRVSIELTAPETCVWRSSFGAQPINGYIDVKIKLSSDREISVPRRTGTYGPPYDADIFSRDLFNDGVDLIDLGTGEVLPPMPRGPHSEPICLQSWAQTRELGFKVGAEDVELDPMENFIHFEANACRKLDIRPRTKWWRYYVRNGLLKNGHQYAFRLKPALTIPRWTYGKPGDLKGPFNLPPIPVAVGEKLYSFNFRVESIGAPHGSFNT